MRELNPQPTVLLEIATGLTSAGNEWIRITSDDADRAWPTGGNTFTARPFEAQEFTVSGEDRPGIRITFSDTDGYWNTWLASTSFKWSKVRRWLIDRGVTNLSTQAQLDTFRIISRDRGDRTISFNAEPYTAILSRIRVPGQSLTREDFPGLPNEPFGG